MRQNQTQLAYQGDLTIVMFSGNDPIHDITKAAKTDGIEIVNLGKGPETPIYVSETTGHDHRIKGARKVEQIRTQDDGVVTLVHPGTEDAEIAHFPDTDPDHAAIKIPAGEGAVVIQPKQMGDERPIVVAD